MFAAVSAAPPTPSGVCLAVEESVRDEARGEAVAEGAPPVGVGVPDARREEQPLAADVDEQLLLPLGLQQVLVVRADRLAQRDLAQHEYNVHVATVLNIAVVKRGDPSVPATSHYNCTRETHDIHTSPSSSADSTADLLGQ